MSLKTFTKLLLGAKVERRSQIVRKRKQKHFKTQTLPSERRVSIPCDPISNLNSELRAVASGDGGKKQPPCFLPFAIFYIQLTLPMLF